MNSAAWGMSLLETSSFNTAIGHAFLIRKLEPSSMVYIASYESLFNMELRRGTQIESILEYT